ncbi:protein serine/threonine phosphatase 2C [Aspergillus sclerotioniger CBS 115572]|uniref:Protein serine/threonine phosphatase 2C n=1 Tax=Aspergillus sclerotioniger CBS 115572 TaxID=1450535 RepID=A0A317VQY1_9EURO|nr:protein serine/threonine phosphatase 2C [Aspergillus sclerotioniger CBS 115572]PWY75302.1 protein serine/threonine phosphatase 2C [Aspergillus sclerotioniger CBS 115572]
MAYNTGSQNPGLDWKFQCMSVLDVKQATAKIKRNEASYKFQSGEIGTVSRIDTNQVPSNNPIEDHMATGKIDLGKGGIWHCWAIYDGHGGEQTAIVLSHALIPYVERALRAHFESSPETTIEDSIITAFNTLAEDISADGLAALESAHSHAEVQARLAPNYAGSCALLALYNPSESMLYVANTGDSRAVLGTPAESGSVHGTVVMSNDHAAANEAEVERLKALHPDQDDIITKRDGDCARYVGIAVTRAFGDARWNWPKEAMTKWEKEYSGKPAPGSVTNPPYLEATPEVKSYKLKGGEFLILASDGLWNHLTSEDAVEAVSKWVKVTKEGTLAEVGSGTPLAFGGEETSPDHAEGISYWDPWQVKPEWFVYEDDNAATHLVKNGLGGAQRQLFTGVLTVDTPVSRTMRDDVTVQVVFFDGA